MNVKSVSPERVLTNRQHFNLSLYWFALNFHWGAMLAVALPVEILNRTHASQAFYLGLVAGGGSLIGMIVQPVAGAFSDRSHFRWGRRRPFILAGALIDVVGLLWMPRAGSLLTLAVAFVLVQLGNNISGAAYQGFIPDQVLPEQRGKASGYMGLMSMVGTISSFGIAAALIRPGDTTPFYDILALILLVGAVLTVLWVPDSPAQTRTDTSHSLSWLDSLKDHDFLWLSITRALVMLSLYGMVTFIEYFVRDKLGLPNFVLATLIIASIGLGGSLVSALAAGMLSDKVGRKGIVCFASLMMAVTFAVFATSPSWSIVLIIGVLFGLGYGAYMSVDWALALDVLPDKHYVARDLGVWGFASTLPQTLAPLAGGVIINWIEPVGWGYPGVFILASLSSLVAALLVWRIRSVR